jgi:hypothetical protein
MKWKIACSGMLVLSLFFGSCSSDDFNVGGYLVTSPITAGVLDTVTIRVSNLVASDSVVALGGGFGRGGTGFSGMYIDPQIGAVQAHSYIEFSRTSDRETDRYARFDSVTLVLRPNGNYYGDTLKRASFKVARLLKSIERSDEGYLFSTDTVPTDVPFSEKRAKIKVKDIQNNEFEIRLDDDFGKELFQGVLSDNDDFKGEQYQKVFPGLSVGAGAGSDCVLGLNLQDTACMVRIYYHVNVTHKEEKTMTFKANPHNSFYNMTGDRSKLRDPFINAKSDPVPSAKTDNKGYITSGYSPMYVRLEFPYLNEILWLGQIVKIQKATLYVRPVRNTFDTIPLPPKLNIYYFDPTSNTVLSDAIRPPSMGGSNTGPQQGNLPENYQDIQSPDFPQYVFDVTDFIASQLGQVGYNKWALSLAIPTDARENTLQRLVFGDQQYEYKNESQSRTNRIKLEITYEVYND